MELHSPEGKAQAWPGLGSCLLADRGLKTVEAMRRDKRVSEASGAKLAQELFQLRAVLQEDRTVLIKPLMIAGCSSAVASLLRPLFHILLWLGWPQMEHFLAAVFFVFS